MLRRDPVLPVYLGTGSYEVVGTRVTTAETVKELAERLISKKKAAEEKITMNIAKAQNKQKKNYGERHSSKCNKIVVDSVLLKKKIIKWEEKWKQTT